MIYGIGIPGIGIDIGTREILAGLREPTWKITGPSAEKLDDENRRARLQRDLDQLTPEDLETIFGSGDEWRSVREWLERERTKP